MNVVPSLSLAEDYSDWEKAGLAERPRGTLSQWMQSARDHLPAATGVDENVTDTFLYSTDLEGFAERELYGINIRKATPRPNEKKQKRASKSNGGSDGGSDASASSAGARQRKRASRLRKKKR